MNPGSRSARRSPTPIYAVITADLVESRHLANRADAQERLAHLVERLNVRLRENLAAPFMVTLGDEIQGMLGDPGRVPAAVVGIHEFFHPREVSIGIGVGGLATGLVRRVTEMDGLAFTRSRSAVERAKQKRREVVVQTGDDRRDGTLNAVYSLLGGIMAAWTRTQWQRVNLYRELGTIEAVARALGVAKQSVSKSLRHTLWLRVLEAEAHLPSILSDGDASAPAGRSAGGRAARKG